jgi:hypothetical protein
VRRAALALVLALPLGCAVLASPAPAPGEAPPAPRLPGPPPTPAVDAALQRDIDRSLPEVSYHTENPALRNPLGTDDPSVLLRRLESLAGDEPIVCEKRSGAVFGHCTFPPPKTP